MHLNYWFTTDSFSVDIYANDNYDGYTGRLEGTRYMDGYDWSDYNYMQGSLADCLAEARKWADEECIYINE